MAIDQKELNTNAQNVNNAEGYIVSLQNRIKTLASNVKTKQGEIKSKKSQIKSETDPTRKANLNKELEKLNGELSQLKYELEQTKQQIEQQKKLIDTQITTMINRPGNEDLRKYVLYTQGKVFDDNIGKYSKEVNDIENTGKILQQREGASSKENNGRKALNTTLEKYMKAKKTLEGKKASCKDLKVDYKTNDEYVKAKAEVEKLEGELKAKFDELKDQLPVENNIAYKDFKTIIDKITMIDGKSEKESIQQGLASQLKTAQKNIKNNMTALEGIIKDGKDMEVNFKGFPNYNNRVQPTLLPTVPKKSIWYKIFHPIKWGREKKTINEARKQIEAQQAAEAGYENYDTSRYNFDDLKGVKAVQDFIARDSKVVLQEAEKTNQSEVSDEVERE